MWSENVHYFACMNPGCEMYNRPIATTMQLHGNCPFCKSENVEKLVPVSENTFARRLGERPE